MLKVCVAGITGWAGSCLASAILKASDLKLAGGVARKSAGKDIGQALGGQPLDLQIVSTLEQALNNSVDVVVDYTKPDIVKHNVMLSIKQGVPIVIGTSGLTSDDYKEIEAAAKKNSVGVIAAGNFSITAALAQHFSLVAARFLPHWEIVDYAHADKIDVPSGTTRELAEQIALINSNKLGRPIDELTGPPEARGANIAGTPVHSVRLPSYVIAFETIFGLPNERLTIRHDAGSGAQPYVDGTLLAVRKIAQVKGLVRGLDTLLFDTH